MGKTMIEQFNEKVERVQRDIIRNIQGDDFDRAVVQEVVEIAKSHLLKTMGITFDWGKITIPSNSLLDLEIKEKVKNYESLLFQELDVTSIITELIEELDFKERLNKAIRKAFKTALEDSVYTIAQELIEKRLSAVLDEVIGDENLKFTGLIHAIERNLAKSGKVHRW